VLALGLVEHPLVAVVERQSEHFAYLEAALALEGLVGVIHIFEVAS
jgi:hypothetical protein